MSFDRIQKLFDAGYVRTANPRVLDIGCSNLHTIDADELTKFVLARNPAHDPAKLGEWARMLAAGGLIDPEIGGTNGAWLGDVLLRAGCEYTAFDIFPGYRTELVDLNEAPLAAHHRGQYDVVLNFGTTEHVLGQYNAFRVIHDATAVGGLIYHDLPMTGHLDHGFVNYNPVLLVSLAEANGYEILDLSFSGGPAGETIGSLAQRYADRDYVAVPEDADWTRTVLPTASVRLIARKVSDQPFRASLETTTTAGDVSDSIGQHYGASKEATVAADTPDPALAMSRVHEVLSRVNDPLLGFAEMNEAYEGFIASGLTKGFPFTLELRMLADTIKAHPEAPELLVRRDLVQSLLRQQRPLLKAVDSLTEAPRSAPSLRFDGIEAEFEPHGDGELRFHEIVEAYRAYFKKSAVELFPARLEAPALEYMARSWPRDTDVLIRLGKVVSELAPVFDTAT